MSFGQRSIWLFERLHPGTVANNLAYALRVRNPIDDSLLRSTLQRVVDRHPMLRATFYELDGIPMQHVHGERTAEYHVESAAGWDEARSRDRLDTEAQRPFDLKNGPLVRFHLFSRSPAEHVIVLCLHHLITDMWSLALLGHEITRLYRLESTEPTASLPSSRYQYRDFVRSQHNMVEGPEGERHRRFWHDEMTGVPRTLGLSTDRPRIPRTTDRGAIESVVIDAALTRALSLLARTNSTTLHNVVLGTFQTLLHRHSGQDDVVVGCMKANRSLRTAQITGCFVNPVALRTDFSDNPSFTELIGRVHHTVEDAFAHDAYPFQRLVEELRPTGDGLDTTPYFQAMFSWQKTSRVVDTSFASSLALGQAGVTAVLNGFMLKSVALGARAAPYDITLLVGEVGDELVATFESKVDLFDAVTVARIASHFHRLLGAAVADPGCLVGELALLSPSELAELQSGWAESVVEYDRDGCVDGLFEDQAARSPLAVAVRFEGSSFTFEELNRRANRLARHLVSLGAGAGTLVGIRLERSLDMVVALLAVLKAGSTFVPLDPAFPPDRLEFMLADSGAGIVVTQSGLFSDAGPSGAVTHVCVDRDADVISRYDSDNLQRRTPSGGVAYVIYTSGSTGRPKGVAGRASQRRELPAGHGQASRPDVRRRRCSSVTTLSFDIAVLEIFLPLIVGAQVVLVAAARRRPTAPPCARRWRASAATVMQATPSTWRMLIEDGWRADARLKVLCGGEALPRDLADRLLVRCGSACGTCTGRPRRRCGRPLFRVGRETRIGADRPADRQHRRSTCSTTAGAGARRRPR